MNKKLTKIASLVLGLTLAVGITVIGTGKKNVSPAYAAVPETMAKAYEVTFTKGANNSDSTQASIASGSEYASISAQSKAYARTKGMHLGSSSAAGSATISLTESAKINATYLSVYAIQVDAGKTLKTTVTYSDATTLKNSTATTDTLTYIDIELDSSKVISSIKFESVTASKGRVAIDSFAIYKDAANVATVESISLSDYTTEYTLNNEFSFDGTCTAHYSDGSTSDVTPTSVSTPDMSTTGTKTVTVTYTEGTTTVSKTYDITVSGPVEVTSITLNKSTTTIEQGNSETLTATVLPENASNKTVTWTVTPADAGVTVVDGVVTASLDATLGDYIVTASAGSVTPATCKVTVTKSTSITDVLTTSNSYSGGAYADWDSIKVTSPAVYAGNSMKSSADAIQLRDNTNSGIVSTTSGGLINKVAVEWNSSTSNGRTLNVYGKTSAYSGTSDLYNEGTQGTLLGTIVKGTSTELVIDGSYTYIGVCSNKSSMYLSSISFTWGVEAEATSELTSIEITGTPTKLSYFVGDVMDITGIDVVAHYSDSSEDKSILANAELELVYDDTPVTLSTTKLDVLASFQGKDAEASFNVAVKEDSIVSITVSGTSNSQFDVFENEELTLEDVNKWILNVRWESGEYTNPTYGGEDGYTLKTTTSGDEAITLPYAWKVGDTQLTFYYDGKFCNKTVTVTPLINKVSYDFSGEITESYVPSSCGYTDTKEVPSFVGTQFSITFSIGTNKELSPKYYNNGAATRLYEGNTFTVTSNNTTPLTKIIIAGTNPGNMTADVGTYSSGTWTGSATSITFTLTGAARISTLTVSYAGTTELVISNDVEFKPAQRAVVEFANTFNSELSAICVAYGTTNAETLKTKWDELASTFTDWFVNEGKSLAAEQKERALLLFKNAKYASRDSVENDALQAMLGKYDEILSHYEFNDFLSSTASRSEAVRSYNVSFLGFDSNVDSSIVIISIISLVGIVSISYFAIKRRREINR